MDTFLELIVALQRAGVRFVVIGVAGARSSRRKTAISSFRSTSTMNCGPGRFASDSDSSSGAGRSHSTSRGIAFSPNASFQINGIDVPVARLTHIVESKRIANRPKDRLFLETHADALRQLLESEKP